MSFTIHWPASPKLQPFSPSLRLALCRQEERAAMQTAVTMRSGSSRREEPPPPPFPPPLPHLYSPLPPPPSPVPPTRPKLVCPRSQCPAAEVASESDGGDLLEGVELYNLQGNPVPISELWKDRTAAVAFAWQFWCIFCADGLIFLLPRRC